jgi:2-oxoglutarate dehydrogenase E2 component (dihydrolipoamide succinyltransferase)
MAVEVKVPAVGESVQEAMIHKWHKASGEFVEMDEVLLELETDKATVEVTAESEGVIETLKNEGDTVAIGEVIAKIDTDAKKPAGASQPASDPQPAASASAPASSPASATAPSNSDAPLSPAVGRMVAEHDLNAQEIPGSGKGGRITKGDVIQFIGKGGSASPAPAAAAPAPAPAPAAPAIEAPPQWSGERAVRREPMSMLRRRIAERLVGAQQTAAILTTFNEVDLSAFMALRKQYKESFKERHGIGLGFMSIFVKAACEALREYPAINGWIEDNEIVYHDYCDIGVAVSSNKGLVVPVIRNAEMMGFAEIEKAIAYYAGKARDGKLGIDEMTGGTFTVSNGGVFGSLLSTPIINPPQSAILGMHKTQERPVVVNGEIVVRPMMYLAVSYDHRIVDGKEAVQFLVKIKECVEDPQRLLLGV